MTGGYWPWWLGAASLAAITVGSVVVGRRPFGVSGIVGRFVNLRAELAVERQRAALAAAGDDALEAALARATAEAFGAQAPEGAPGPSADDEAAGVEAPAARPALGAHAVFLGAIVAGAFLAALASGRFQPSLAPSEDFARLVAGGPWGAAALAAGGLLVGLGTTVSGGCTTGHGLSGCARLQPAGLAATATFFGVAALVSFLLAGRLA